MSERGSCQKLISLLVTFWIGMDLVLGQDWANDRIRACCLAMGARGDCLPLCRFDTTIDELYDRHDCYDQLKIWMYCASENQDHSECCSLRFVPNECHRYCAGSAPKMCFSDAKALQSVLDCGQFMAQILSCHRDTLAALPQWTVEHRFGDEPEC